MQIYMITLSHLWLKAKLTLRLGVVYANYYDQDDKFGEDTSLSPGHTLCPSVELLMMSSSIKLHGSSDLPPNVCAELSDMINDSFFKKLDKYFDQQKEKTMAKEKHKLDYIKRWCEVIERDNKREPEYSRTVE